MWPARQITYCVRGFRSSGDINAINSVSGTTSISAGSQLAPGVPRRRSQPQIPTPGWCPANQRPAPIRLSQSAKRAGCAAKQPPGYLLTLLGSLPPITDPNVLVGNATADDAAVYKLSDDLALVFTTDFFTPIVDRPADFGAIAAANALSDVYAMGATPLTALSIVGYPDHLL